MLYAVVSAWGVEGVFLHLTDAGGLKMQLVGMNAYRGTKIEVLEFEQRSLVQFRINALSIDDLAAFEVK